MFSSPGQYVLQAIFYPELFKGPDSATLKSNRLVLNVKPAVVTAEEKAAGAGGDRRPARPPGPAAGRGGEPGPSVRGRRASGRGSSSTWTSKSLMRKNPEKDRVFRNATEAVAAPDGGAVPPAAPTGDHPAGHQRDPHARSRSRRPATTRRTRPSRCWNSSSIPTTRS